MERRVELVNILKQQKQRQHKIKKRCHDSYSESRTAASTLKIYNPTKKFKIQEVHPPII